MCPLLNVSKTFQANRGPGGVGGGGGNKLQSPMVHEPEGGGAISWGAMFCTINMVPELYNFLLNFYDFVV